ncbi:MAG: BMP family ABC transporter substrate-binding protein [Lachnospiraceae bacterium]|nr:BMP family ABC transporter substrate-binding protein [Lachnospiraceae bacterium]
MKKQHKKLTAMLMAVSAAAALTGCGSSERDAAVAAGTAHIGIIFTQSGLSGNSFNDLALDGVKRAAAELGITYDEVEPKSVSDEEIIQDEMASSEEYDLIICVGNEQVDALNNVASVYTDQKFALLDATSELPNVASYSCKAQEGSFMVGALSVLAKENHIDERLSDNGTVGFLGGVDNPQINEFAAGYQAGAKYVDPEVNVLIDYAGSFNDPTTARTISNIFNEKGADVIFHAAGPSGSGLFQSAQEKDYISIGVNLNQNTIDPEHIMASMLKRLDNCAYHAINSIVKNTYTGENQNLGLADGGVDFTTEGSNIQVPEKIISELDKIKEAIISGEIEVPDKL